MPSARVERPAAAGAPATGNPARLPWAGIGDAAVLLHRLLPLRALCALARAYGWVRYHLRRREAEAVRANLTPFLVAGQSARTLGRWFSEDLQTRRLLLTLAPRLGREELRARCTFRNLEYLEEVARGGGGAIALFSHIHSYGALFAVITLRSLGYDVRTALQTAWDPWSSTRLRRLMWALRGREATVTELMAGFACQFNIRPIVQVLKDGGIVMQTGDGWHSASFVEVPFLGRTLPFPTGMMSVARLTGAPVVPFFGGDRAARMTFTLEEPFRVGRGPGELEQAVARYAARLEAHIRANLAEWDHWSVPHALDTLAAWPDRPLREKYEA
jgi:lauroyl/myristoyl acyltransferase